ncbi:beta strand repeat-containing protein [uncultured Nostoc sp.]|uniref:beta strand repeat-containing protein n=1 Tax=uncultured Nostoc sp. TaxID=340711 RepID=UPI0035CC5B23
MVNRKKSLNKQRQRYQSLVATALLTSSLFQFIAPVLADGTAGGQAISNTATATYEDPNAPGTTINATSNTVTVTVAEVAGITVTASGVTDINGGSVAVSDLLTYTYTLTNVGNDPTKFHIPNQATTTGPGTVSGVLPNDKNGATPASGTLQYSTDGGATWTNVTAGGVDTPSIPVSGTVLVRVPVTVQTGAQSGDVIKVTLGNTPGDAQNQLRSPNGGDVYTVDNADGTPGGEVAGAPINGTREASITQQIQVGNSVKTVALATILKTRTAYNPGNASVLNDDVLTYGLSLRVESNDVTNRGLTPAALAGTSINVDGNLVTRILVSDALPASTTLNGTPTAPPGWIVVYAGEDPATTTADQALWKTNPTQVTGGTVKRVGFINNPSSISTVATGTTVTGFTVQVTTTGITGTTATNVNNIAQVFGKTAGDPASPLLFDDSGDQNPDNINPTTGAFPTTVDPGYYATTPANTDTGNNNQGTPSATGNVNVYTISTATANSVLNGPNNAPDATGPSGLTNDDFTNKSAFVPPNTAPGSTLDPQSVGFTNTIKNNGTAPNDITIVPTAPATATDLPNNTKVTVSYNNQSAVYTYNNGTFTIAAGTPIKISGVAAGASVNYGVEVDLPAGTQLSTDIGKGFPVPITALIDTNNNGVVDGAEVYNISIDRVYTGFLQLVKVSRVLQGTGPAVGAGQDNFESTPAYTNPVTTTVIDPNPGVADVPRNPAPGNIIEYQIRYKNISDAQAGTGNVILNANKVVISEDGTQNPNNWALDNDNNTQIDTSNIVGSAKDSGASTIQFFSGNPATTSGIDQTGTTINTDITKYVDTATGQVAPGIQRTFTFQRKVN